MLSLEIALQTNLSEQSSVNKTWTLLCCYYFSVTSMHSDTDLLILKEPDLSDIFSLIYLHFLWKLVICYCHISERCSKKIHINNWSSEKDIEKSLNIWVTMPVFLENVYGIQTCWTKRGVSKVKLAFFTKTRPLERRKDLKLEWSPLVLWLSTVSLYILCPELY